MIFSKEKNLAFVLPLKTGTQTIRHFLNQLNWTTLESPKTHNQIYELINEYPNLNNYTIYGFLRNPLHRFESAILHMKRIAVDNEHLGKVIEKQVTQGPLETASYENIVEAFPAMVATFPRFFDPQVKWLDHPKVTVLDFDNLEVELRRITGNTTESVPILNVATDYGKSVITDKVRAFVREYYAADYALAKDRLGKEFA